MNTKICDVSLDLHLLFKKGLLRNYYLYYNYCCSATRRLQNLQVFKGSLRKQQLFINNDNPMTRNFLILTYFFPFLKLCLLYFITCERHTRLPQGLWLLWRDRYIRAFSFKTCTHQLLFCSTSCISRKCQVRNFEYLARATCRASNIFSIISL